VEITPIALDNIYWRFYIILAVFNVCNAVIIFFCFPETKKLSLEEIDFLFVQKYGGPAEMTSPECYVQQTGVYSIDGSNCLICLPA
jgi:Sugar (and other) transporter